MRIRINGKEYSASASFWSLVRYRQEYGVSFLHDTENGFLALLRLVYVSLEDCPLYFHQFEQQVLADPACIQTLQVFQAKALSFDVKKSAEAAEPTEEKSDELYTLVTWQQLGLPMDLLREFNMRMVMATLDAHGAVMMSKYAPKPMQRKDRKQLYGITPERERQLEEYLRKEAAANGG